MLPQVSPPPKPDIITRSPSLRRPERESSSKSNGTEAPEVLPQRSTFIGNLSASAFRCFITEAIILAFA